MPLTDTHRRRAARIVHRASFLKASCQGTSSVLVVVMFSLISEEGSVVETTTVWGPEYGMSLTHWISPVR